MARKIIKLTSEKELKIFMDPLRQRVLRTMELVGTPITAKGLADRMKMTAPSAKHHLTQLESIGLVELDHTELIHGITAQYYRVSDVEVRLGMDERELKREKEIIAENQVMSVFRDFVSNVYGNEDAADIGDCHIGVVHLKDEQLTEIRNMILQFVEENRNAGEGTTPYEYALVYAKGQKS